MEYTRRRELVKIVFCLLMKILKLLVDELLATDLSISIHRNFLS